MQIRHRRVDEASLTLPAHGRVHHLPWASWEGTRWSGTWWADQTPHLMAEGEAMVSTGADFAIASVAASTPVTGSVS